MANLIKFCILISCRKHLECIHHEFKAGRFLRGWLKFEKNSIHYFIGEICSDYDLANEFCERKHIIIRFVERWNVLLQIVEENVIILRTAVSLRSQYHKIYTERVSSWTLTAFSILKRTAPPIGWTPSKLINMIFLSERGRAKISLLCDDTLSMRAIFESGMSDNTRNFQEGLFDALW